MSTCVNSPLNTDTNDRFSYATDNEMLEKYASGDDVENAERLTPISAKRSNVIKTLLNQLPLQVDEVDKIKKEVIPSASQLQENIVFIKKQLKNRGHSDPIVPNIYDLIEEEENEETGQEEQEEAKYAEQAAYPEEEFTDHAEVRNDIYEDERYVQYAQRVSAHFDERYNEIIKMEEILSHRSGQYETEQYDPDQYDVEQYEADQCDIEQYEREPYEKEQYEREQYVRETPEREQYIRQKYDNEQYTQEDYENSSEYVDMPRIDICESDHSYIPDCKLKDSYYINNVDVQYTYYESCSEGKIDHVSYSKPQNDTLEERNSPCTSECEIHGYPKMFGDNLYVSNRDGFTTYEQLKEIEYYKTNPSLKDRGKFVVNHAYEIPPDKFTLYDGGNGDGICRCSTPSERSYYQEIQHERNMYQSFEFYEVSSTDSQIEGINMTNIIDKKNNCLSKMGYFFRKLFLCGRPSDKK